MTKYRTDTIETTIARYFDPRRNLIVPNVSWGMRRLNHECDLLIITKNNYAYEVEIKVDKYDLIKDKLKPHHHKSTLLRKLWFAIPYYLIDQLHHIPADAGILCVGIYPQLRIVKLRDAAVLGDYKITEQERCDVARLGALRIWGLKDALHVSEINYRSLREKYDKLEKERS